MFLHHTEWCFATDPRRSQRHQPAGPMDRLTWSNRSRGYSVRRRKVVAERRRIGRPGSWQPHHPTVEKSWRGGLARVAGLAAGDAREDENSKDGLVPTKPYHPIRVPHLQSAGRRSRTRRVYHIGLESVRRRCPAEYMVRECGDIPGLLADEDLEFRLVSVAHGRADRGRPERKIVDKCKGRYHREGGDPKR